ncbi:MAG TPA: riboflavin kinase [Candidatus Saccharimonadales bacterium]|nr:riboflavin kinase [Candidatus Saccharimonadales bacterium]
MEDMEAGGTLKGTVVRFSGDGRRLGYPTANLTVDTSAKDGVYFGWADLAGYEHHPSIIFIGVPTTTGDDRRRVEAYLLGIPDKDYYGLPMALTLGEYHRGNRTFADTDELIDAMKADEAAARLWFKDQGRGKP